MIFTFSPDGEGACCLCSQGDVSFDVAPAEGYINRETVFFEGSLLFDGYSDWFRGRPETLPQGEEFTLSLAFIPLSYSTHSDGLFCCYCSKENRGLELCISPGGIINVSLGLGTHSVKLSSIRAHALLGTKNLVSLVYRGYCGWCELYVNGIHSSSVQFARHTPLLWPDKYAYIGRRSDRVHGDSLPFGCFYGFIDYLQLEASAERRESLLSAQRESFTGKREQQAFILGRPRREAYFKDRQRPQYHLQPSGKWMNEPHGPMYYRGFYHIFFQSNPHAPLWDHLSWGHLVSRDMLHWAELPPALMPEDSPICADGCWSGSSLIDKNGVPRLFFTAGKNKDFPNQYVAEAIPNDADDPLLKSWHISPSPVQRQDIGWPGEFRDPFVWLEGGEYFMLVGTGDADNGGGNAALYSSGDGLTWQSHGFICDYDFFINKEVGHIWELPVLLPLKDESGEIFCHILIFCAAQIEGDIVENYYFLGHWQPEKRRFERIHDRAALLDLGKGVFTGPSGFVTPDGRAVIFSIAQGKRSFLDEIRSGWAHNGGLPAELSIRKGELSIRPIRELEGLKGELLLKASSPELQELNRSLAHLSGDKLCFTMSAAGDRAAFSLLYGGQELCISYERSLRRLRVLDGAGKEIGRFRGSIDEVDIGDEPIHFDCYLDHSMLEVYLNEKKSLTLRNYLDDGERFFRVDSDISTAELWRMTAAYGDN